MDRVEVKIKKLREDVLIPAVQTFGSVGYDVYSYCPEGIPIPSGEIVLIPTGFSLEIPVGYDIEVRPRSGFSTKTKILIPNSPGTIDSDYRGEVFVPLFNLSGSDFLLEHHTRIAQILLRKSLSIEWELTEEDLSQTSRGEGGFGSTGTK
ncbi:MAG: dUTP diphosphatase [Leptospiraceae bacterium]|nr:dUTP diphosphatase [Leptospiraceae bacterium]MCP5513202.1 dUTP diphosphatase [Leptospiraceae bacterium]